MLKLFIDTNIIIDFFVEREPFSSDASKIFELVNRKEITIFVSITSFNNIYYILRKTYRHQKTLDILEQLKKTVQIIDFTKSILNNSMNSKFNDLEDAIQYFSAIEIESIKYIITRDKKGFKHSKIPVYNPKTFLKIYKEL